MIRQHFCNIKKYLFAFILLLIPPLLCLLITILLILNTNTIMSLIKWDKSDTITLLASSILPFILSIAFASFGFAIKSFIDIRDKTIAEINGLNETIKAYNLVVIRTIKRYNILMTNFINLLKVKEKFVTISPFKSIVEYWEEKTSEIIELSNYDEFRLHIRNKTSEFLNNKIEDVSIFHYLENMTIIPVDMETFNNNDSIFLFMMREKLNLNEEEIDIFTLFCDLFGTGIIFNKALNEYNYNIEKYIDAHKTGGYIFEIEYSNITNILYGYFHLLELIIIETFITYIFLNIIVNKFKVYHNVKLNEYRVVNDIIKPHELLDKQEKMMKKLMKYINKQKIYEHYGINMENKKNI